MTQYLLQPRDQIFVKGYEFFSFARNMGRSIGENISKNVIDKYSQKRLYHGKKSDTDGIKTASKRAIQKTAAATGNLMAIKLLIELQKSQKLHLRIIQKQMKKYLKKTENFC